MPLVSSGVWFDDPQATALVAPPLPRSNHTPFNSFWYGSNADSFSEVITPDKWFSEISQPVLPRKSPLLVNETYQADPVAGMNLGRLDQYWLQLSQPVLPQPFSRRPSTADPLVEPTLYVIPPMDSWFHQLPGPVLLPQRAGPCQFALVIDYTFLGIGQLDQWFFQMPQPVRTAARPPFLGGEFYLAEPLTVAIGRLEQWWEQARDPVRLPLTAGGTSYVFPLEPNTIFAGAEVQWYVQWPEPRRAAWRSQPGWLATTTEPTQIGIGSLTQWFIQQPDPRRPLAPAGGSYFVEPWELGREGLMQLHWYSPLSLPVKGSLYAMPAWLETITEPTQIGIGRLDQWFVQPLTPLQLPWRVNYGVSEQIFEPFTIGATSLGYWSIQLPDPIRRGIGVITTTTGLMLTSPIQMLTGPIVIYEPTTFFAGTTVVGPYGIAAGQIHAGGGEQGDILGER